MEYLRGRLAILRSTWLRLFERTESPLPLAVFRISFCAVLLYDVAFTLIHRRLLFDDVPYAEPVRFPMGAALSIWLLAVVFLLVGLQTRIAALVNYIFSVLFIGFSAFEHDFEGHWDVLILQAGWVFALLPVGRALSIDAWLTQKRAANRAREADTRISRVGELVIIGIIGTLYLDSCGYKLSSSMYLLGLGLWAPASLPYNLHGTLPALLNSQSVSIAMGYFALLFELAFIVLVWFRGIRAWLVTAGIAFHVTILIFFPIWSFSFMMVALYLGLLPGQKYERMMALISRRGSATVNVEAARAELESQAQVPNPILVRLATGGFLFWLVSVFILSWASPFFRTYLPIPEQAANRMRAVATKYKSTFYAWTGFSTHGVFVEEHFRDYNFQVRLLYHGPRGTLQLPIVDVDGTCIDYNSGRVWALWAFRTVRPGLRLKRASANLVRFMEYWRAREGMTRGTIEVLVRPVHVVLDEWQADLLHRNTTGPWSRIGHAKLGNSIASIVWETKTSRDTRLVDLMEAAVQRRASQ